MISAQLSKARAPPFEGTQYCNGGWKRHQRLLCNPRGRKIAMDVARGLDKMHSRHIIHLDLKSPNVLLTAGGTAKIAVRPPYLYILYPYL